MRQILRNKIDSFLTAFPMDVPVNDAFRGAQVDNLISFLEDFVELQKMEAVSDYRSKLDRAIKELELSVR